MDERELLARVRRGDEAAFEALVRLYEKKIYTLCFRMCGSAQDAEEAAQDTFLALWRGAAGFREESSLSTWLYRLAVNASVDLLRRRKRASGTLSLDDEDAFLNAADPAPPPEEASERRETHRLLQAGLLALPERYREILLLREVEDLSYAEIASVTSLDLGSVKSRINRGRRLLRNYLSSGGNFFASPASKVTECNRKEGNAP